MDSAYAEMAVPNCPSEVGECDGGVESVSSLTTFSDLPPMMHALEPSLDATNVKLQLDSSEELPPPNATHGLTQFTTVEFSGFAQTSSSETDEILACESSSGAVADSADQLEDGRGLSSSSAPVSLASQGVFQALQHIPPSHVAEQRPISEPAASPIPPSGSCGSGVSPAASTSSQASPWPSSTVCLSNSDSTTASMSFSATSVSSAPLVSSLSSDSLRSEKPQPPKKPLTPYMRFSKSIWQQVKAANPTLSVCEVGAAIGKLWREMGDTEKQRYNEDFAIDKVRYDDELQSYLKLTGLHTSDLPKPKAKRKDVRPQTLLRPTVPQVMPFGAVEPTASAAPLSCEQTAESLTTAAAVSAGTNGSANGTLRATGFQTVAMSGDCSGLGSLPHFSQVWAGQEVFANQQLLAQIGMAAGQTVYAGQTMGETTESQDTNQNEGTQVTSLYSGQNQSLQNIGSQDFAGHLQMSVGQIDDNSVMTSRDNAWLWQQYNAGNQFVQDMMTQSSLPQSQNQEGIIIYQLTSDGTAQNSPAETNHALPGVMLAKSSVVAAANGTMETVLEPGEIPLSGTLQASVSNGAVKPGVYDLNQLCGGLADWTQATKDDGSGDFVQPVDGEKQLLRGALLEKSKEIQRLTRELELAYGLIHQLKQQTDLYQRHWNGQQQQQQLQQQQQQQQQLHVIPKTEVTTGLGIGS